MSSAQERLQAMKAKQEVARRAREEDDRRDAEALEALLRDIEEEERRSAEEERRRAEEERRKAEEARAEEQARKAAEAKRIVEILKREASHWQAEAVRKEGKVSSKRERAAEDVEAGPSKKAKVRQEKCDRCITKGLAECKPGGGKASSCVACQLAKLSCRYGGAKDSAVVRRTRSANTVTSDLGPDRKSVITLLEEITRQNDRLYKMIDQRLAQVEEWCGHRSARQ